jgi:hypothetical protein
VGLKDRVSKLERRTPPPAPRTGSFAEEIRAIDAEIRKLEVEMRAEGIDPYAEAPLDEGTRAFMESLKGLSLDEQIKALEAGIAREEAKR